MNSSLKLFPILAMVAAASLSLFEAGCAHVKVDPIEVKEIHIVHDVNIKVDKQLDEFFAFQDQHPATQSTTAPTTTTTQTAADTGEIR